MSHSCMYISFENHTHTVIIYYSSHMAFHNTYVWNIFNIFNMSHLNKALHEFNIYCIENKTSL